MNRLSAIAATIGDRTNPVVVKELRQAVRSRLVIAILMLFLLTNAAIVSGFLLLNEHAATSERAGQDLFNILFSVLVVTCMIFVPLYAAIRLTVERNDSNIDLVFITTISPAAIIRGKFGAAVALTALIYCACMPFLTLTYLLRGIDLPSIFFALATAFLMTAVAIMLAIFAGSIAGGLFLRLLLGGILLWVGGWIMMYALLAGIAVAQMGLASMFRGNEAWLVFGVCLLLGSCAWGLLYLLAVAAVSPRSSNRMFPIRVLITSAWVIFGILLGTWSLIDKSNAMIVSWVVISVGLLGILGLSLAERESWSPRVRRRIPRSAPGRFVAWLFFTGSAGGVLWSFLLASATLLIGRLMIASPALSTVVRPIAPDMVEVMCGVLLYAWCYSMSGLLLRRIFAPRSVPLAGTAAGLMLFGIGCALPLLLGYLIQGPFWRFDALPVIIALTSPLVLSRTGPEHVVVYCFLVIWAVLGFAANIPWFRRQWRAFRRYDPAPVASSAALIEEPTVAHV